MIYVSVDVEADGPCPGLYSLLSVGAIVVEPGLSRTFYTEVQPIAGVRSDRAALAASGFAERNLFEMPNPCNAIPAFADWLDGLGDRPLMLADNAGFDWQFVNYYFYRYVGRNPFGHSCLSLTSLYKGYERQMRANFRRLRKTKHTHNALDDAKGNAEAFLWLLDNGLQQDWK